MVRIIVLPSKVTSLRWTILSIYRIWGTIVKIQNSSAFYLHFFSVCARTDGDVQELFTIKLMDSSKALGLVLNLYFYILFIFKGIFPNFITFRIHNAFTHARNVCLCVHILAVFVCIPMASFPPSSHLGAYGSPDGVMFSFTHVFKCLWIV